MSGQGNNQSGQGKDQPTLMREIVGLAITDRTFREAIRTNMQQAISDKRTSLGFEYADLTQQSVQILQSITPQEFDMLEGLYEKGRPGGMKPNWMF
jgi:hypothetical protein